MIKPAAADQPTAVAALLDSPLLTITDSLRISQLYGGGGNSGATFTHDFVELFNQGSTAVSLNGLSLQYTSATGTGNFGASSTQLAELPNATLQPGQYFLVQLASGTNGGPLPTPDYTDPTPINLSGTNGKLVLVNGTDGLGCNGSSTPCDAAQLSRIIDLVGFGSANFYEGTAAAPVLSITSSALRLEGGCQDTDDNGADFTNSNPPVPRNTSSPINLCGTAVPSVLATDPIDGATNVALGATIAVTFSEPVTVTANWFTLACTVSGVITGTTSPAGPTDQYTITPPTPFDYDEQCTVTLLASEISNGSSSPAADYSFDFSTQSTVGDITFVYHDLEDVVQPGESVYIVGEFNGWDQTANPLAADANFDTFSLTLPGIAADDYEYKYIVYTDTVPTGPAQWDWLNSANRTLTVVGTDTVDDYRNVTVNWANLQWPLTVSTTMGVPTENIYGRLYIPNVTNTPGASRALQAEVGYGDTNTPADWDWFPMTFWADDGANNDEFTGVITATGPGVFSYTTRFDANWATGNPNANWTYASLNGVPFDPAQTGVLTVDFDIVPIATARAGDIGDIFAIEGQAIAVNGNWNNAPEWALQDASGGISAFFLTDPAVSLGDTVRVVATLGSFNGQEQMTSPVEYFEIVSAGPPVEPITYTTGQVASGISEGWLVYLEGAVTNMPATCGTAYTVRIDDGSGETQIRIEAATGINLCDLGIEVGDNLGFTGYSTEYQGTYQVKPRSLADLQFIAEAPLVISTTPAHNATGVLTDTDIIIQFNSSVNVTADWFTIQCSESGVVTAVSSPASPATTYTLTPAAPFVSGEMCAVTVLADQVTDQDGVNMLTNHRFSFAVGTPPPFGVCGDPAIPVHFVQGDGDVSPLVGNTAVIEAVVVGDYQGGGQFNGYYVQEEDADADGDPNTSEGLFIANTSTAVAPGDLVRVLGTVSESNSVTQLTSVSNTLVCDTAQSVTPTVMTLPVADMSEWEAVEGMLVTFSQDLHVTESYTLGRYGEVHLSVNDRIWQPTNIAAPGAPALAQQELNSRSRILLDDGSGVQNPANVIYPDPGLTFTNTLRANALVHNLTGVVDYRFNVYRIQPVGAVDFTNTDDRPQTPDSVGGNVTVASFNVLNYFTTLDLGPDICGPDENMECRGADSVLEFERQREKILNALLEMDADVVGLIEIENNVNDDAVIDIVDGLNEATAPGTYDYIDTGIIGSDAIKLALIYQPGTVTPVGDYAILDSTVDPTFLDTKNRPVLIQTFAENESGERITVAVNHLKSKGSDCDSIGDPDTGDGQGNCNITRTTAATALVNYLATDPTNSGTDRFLIIGDLNSYAMEDPITVLKDADYVDLLREFYGDQAYTYVFDGQFGHLDHALASEGALPFVTGATSWHINADEPYALDYNTEFKSAQQVIDWYGEAPFRSSDHDPVLVGLNLTTTVPVTPTVTITSPEDGDEFVSPDGTAVTVPVVISTTDFVIPTDGYWRLFVNGVDTESVLDYSTTVDLAPGSYTLAAELYASDDTPLGIIDSVDITVIEDVTAPTVTITSPEDGDEFVSPDGTAVTVPVVISTTDFVIPTDGYWRLFVNGVDTESVLDYSTTVDLVPGSYTLAAELYASDDTPLGIIDSVDITVIEDVTAPTVTITSPEDGDEFVSPDGTAVTVPVVISTTDFVIPTDGYWRLFVNGVDTESVLDYSTTVDLAPGSYTLAAELYASDDTPLGIIDSVQVTVTEAVAPQGYTIYLPLIIKPADSNAQATSSDFMAWMQRPSVLFLN